MVVSCPTCRQVGPAKLTLRTKDWVCTTCGEWRNLRIVQYCTHCGFVGVPVLYEGLLGGDSYVCPTCGGRQTVIPADSPTAQAKLRGRPVPWEV